MKIILPILFIFILSSSALKANDSPDLLTLYKELHAYPELSFKEEKTSKKLADIMKILGFEVTENFGGYGVVALLKNGEGKTVMLRADMDGLPVKELTGASYASKTKSLNQVGDEVFTMHACGHDIHMTSLMGTAINLMKRKDEWRGNLIILFQPAEEVGSGARNIIKAGIFEKFPRPDFNLALHVSADLPAGKVGYVPGWAMANVDSLDITVKGRGGHGAYPHTTKDPIVMASQLINSLQTIVSREIAPIEAAVVTVGSIHGGTKHNVIPNEVRLQLTLRSYTDEVRNQTISTIRRMARGLAEANGLPKDLYPEITLKDEYTPALFNNLELTEKLRISFENVLGKDNVLKLSPVMGGEDFGMYGRVEPLIPSVLFWLGAVNNKVYDKSLRDNISLPSLHSALFLPDPEPTISTGVKAMTAAVLDLYKN
ncbi:MAG TPA: amidohydrolase [Gammaproteobacteria bacterium]|nr:amidohydrolase [Gammaproteobacteria bacterium]